MGWHRTGRFFSWLGELRILYLAVLYVLLGFVLIWRCDASEQSIRIVGLGLQVLGIGTVVWGIAETRKQFGHPPVIRLICSWFRRCPLIRRKAYLQPEGISVGASVVSGRLETVFSPDPNVPLEDRLKLIEKGLETIQKRLERAEAKIDRESNNAHGKILAEIRGRENADQDIMKALESTSTGGVHISAIGAIWLFFGVILSTTSSELAAWLT